jgi:hypothetical protein
MHGPVVKLASSLASQAMSAATTRHILASVEVCPRVPVASVEKRQVGR